MSIFLFFFSALLLCSCVNKNAVSLTFSSGNTPTASLKLNNDLPYTTDRSISVQIDSSQEIELMTFALGSTCSAHWEPYTKSKSVELPDADGEYSYSVKLKSKDGFESDCVHKKVTMDRVGPTLTNPLALSSVTSSPKKTPRINPPQITDTHSGVARYEIKLLRAADSTVIANWTEKDRDALLFDNLSLNAQVTDEYYFLIRAYDKVGNVGREEESPRFSVAPTVALAAGDSSFSQKQAMGYITVELSRANVAQTTVFLKSISGSAIAGVDFLFPDIIPEQVVIPAGQTSQRVYFSIKTNHLADTDKSFKLQVTNSINATSELPTKDVTLVNHNPVPSAASIASGYRAVSGHLGYMCGVRTDNKLDCWGDLAYANGHLSSKPHATEVPGISNIQTIGFGPSDHNCYIDSLGELYCFGLNAKKQLGTYNTTPSVAPIKINGFTNVKKVAVGKDYTCFINSANQLYCLGSNSSLKTGLDGSDSTIIGTPTLSPYFTKVLDVSTGEETTCAIDEIGAARSVKCWGLIEKRWERDPQLVTNTPHDIIKISLGAQPSLDISIRPESHACGTTESGDVYCWGANSRYQRGSLGTPTYLIANKVPLSVKAVKVQVGVLKTCALGEDGKLYCWGAGIPSATDPYQLIDTATPTLVSKFNERIIDFQLTPRITCAVLESSKMACWGSNSAGEAGNGYSEYNYQHLARTPDQNFDSKYIQVATGLTATCAIKSDKTVQCWGDNTYGQLGVTGLSNSLRPRQIPGLTSIKRIAGRLNHFCAISEAGAVYCWGSNTFGQIGNGSSGNTVTIPFAVPGLNLGTKDIVVTETNTCALTSANSVTCWGSNFSYVSGFPGSTADLLVPTPVSSLSNVESIAAGIKNICVIRINTANRELLCWGSDNGILGTAPTDTAVPVSMDTITDSGKIELSIGERQACYTMNGGAHCWGTYDSATATLPNDIPVSIYTPKTITSLAGATQISMGPASGCTIMQTGQPRCWGADTFGHFSPPLSPPVPSVIPKDVFAFANGKVVQISVSRNYACAVTSMGDLRCWGRNSHDRSATLFHNHDTFYQSEPGFVLR